MSVNFDYHFLQVFFYREKKRAIDATRTRKAYAYLHYIL